MKKKKRRIKKESILCLIFITILIIILLNTFMKNDKKENKSYVKEEKIVEPEKKEENKKEERKISLVMVGDVLIHEAVFKDASNGDGTYEFHQMFDEIKPLLEGYDLRYCNQESIIGGKSLGISGYPNFNSPDEIGNTIVDLGFNMIGLANNHAFDKGEKAINYSVNYWKKYDNIITAGSYLNEEDRNDIKIYEKNGIKYAFLAYTTGINGNSLNNKDYLVNIYDKDKVKQDIEKVKEADLIIVAMHWGNEYTNEPTKSQRDIAEYLSSLGVDLIIGTHPHVVQPITYIGDTLVIYSLGNFISNQLVIGINPAIGLLVGLDIELDDNGQIKFDITKKELLYSYSENSKNFKVIPFSKMNDDILNDYKNTEKEYMNIVNKEL